MTPKELLQSKILYELFETPPFKKNKIRCLAAAGYISKLLNTHLLAPQLIDTPDPAREYLQKLRHDKNILSRLKTHQGDIQPTLDLILIKEKACALYIKKFRKKPTMRLNEQFLFFALNRILSPLRYNERITVITKLCLLAKGLDPNETSTREARTMQVLRRINVYYKSRTSAPLKSHQINHASPESNKSNMALFALLDKFSNEEPHILPSEIIPLKESHSTALGSAIKSAMQRSLQTFLALDKEMLRIVLVELRIPDIDKSLQVLIQDNSFKKAFELKLSAN